MKTIRTFIAIDIPDMIRNRIAELQTDLKNVGGRISWVKVKNIHLTLKFLGKTLTSIIDDIDTQLNEATNTIPPFEIHVTGVGMFPDFRRPRVIWIGADSEKNQLQQLADNIESRMELLGFNREKRRFSPHLTIGRVKDIKGIEPIVEKLQQYDNFEAGSFIVKQIFLIKSELHPAGAIYTPLRTINLSNH